ncbi:MAG: amino acid racemase [Pseudomonadota bacterium]
MKTLGMLGGLSWRSTIFYYEGINAAVEAALGPMHSARIAMWSFDLQSFFGEGMDWRSDAAPFISAAQQLESDGADGVLIAANSAHLHAEAIEGETDIPLVHIGDAVGAAVRERSIRQVGLIGIPATMEERFYIDRINQHGIEVVVPDTICRAKWGELIYEELFAGDVTDKGARLMQETLAYFDKHKCEAVILGCTELRMLPRPEGSMPALDSVDLHVEAATRFILDEGKA